MVVGAARAAGVGRLMNYDGFFTDAIGRVRRELRYRLFADLERIAGRFPRAISMVEGIRQSGAEKKI